MSKNKGGRPAKKSAEKLTYRVPVKLTALDFHSLKYKAKQAGMSHTELARMAIIGCQIHPRRSPEEMDYLRKLCGMGNNLNQIARKANAAGYTPYVRGEYLLLAPEIDKLITRLLHDC